MLSYDVDTCEQWCRELTAATEAPFSIDYIVYESLPNSPVSGEYLQLGNKAFQAQNDSINFSTGWTWSGNTTLTSIPGSSATLSFNGSEVTVFGEWNGSSNVASYLLDNSSTPVPLELQATSPEKLLTNQVLLNLSASHLNPGKHTLVLTFDGISDGTPLSIDYVLVKSLTTKEQEPLTTASATPFPSQTTTISHSPNRSRIIVGSIVPAVVLMLLAAIFLAFKQSQIKKRKGETACDFEGPNILQFHPQEELAHNVTRINPVAERVRLENLKLQQSLNVVQHQMCAQQLAEGSAVQLQHGEAIVHMDSGWRMTESGGQGINEQPESEDPPMYFNTVPSKEL
ncbi:hypothetical protein K435DRAFT_806064 [Dendrothele bispora CBS 962.96]|uniref:Uncharacterized protein n=1 Tax=Dendrothele bispora (strain CBS 962.96) TaxID=1314807 RepID=A0A4S8L9S0_DENBC|nr:hypothetical protein K435DRAFT_806064 [Dendrothele bispora CBS 962.96]